MLHAEPFQIGFVLPQSRYGIVSVHIISQRFIHIATKGVPYLTPRGGSARVPIMFSQSAIQLGHLLFGQRRQVFVRNAVPQILDQFEPLLDTELHQFFEQNSLFMLALLRPFACRYTRHPSVIRQPHHATLPSAASSAGSA